MPGRKKRKQPSGSAKMRALGKHPVLLWFTEGEMNDLRLCAKHDGRSLSGFVRYNVLLACKIYIELLIKEGEHG